MFTSKDLKKLIIPLIFEQLLAVSVGFVDTSWYLLQVKQPFPVSLLSII